MTIPFLDNRRHLKRHSSGSACSLSVAPASFNLKAISDWFVSCLRSKERKIRPLLDLDPRNQHREAEHVGRGENHLQNLPACLALFSPAQPPFYSSSSTKGFRPYVSPTVNPPNEGIEKQDTLFRPKSGISSHQSPSNRVPSRPLALPLCQLQNPPQKRLEKTRSLCQFVKRSRKHKKKKGEPRKPVKTLPSRNQKPRQRF